MAVSIATILVAIFAVLTLIQRDTQEAAAARFGEMQPLIERLEDAGIKCTSNIIFRREVPPHYASGYRHSLLHCNLQAYPHIAVDGRSYPALMSVRFFQDPEGAQIDADNFVDATERMEEESLVAAATPDSYLVTGDRWHLLTSDENLARDVASATGAALRVL